MEIKEFETDILENQIAIDFDELGQEESVSLTETLIKPINHDYIKDEVLFVAVKAQNKNLANNLPQLKLCGKSMLDWLLLAGSMCERITLDDCENIIDKVRGINTDKKIIALFYSDTPLLDKHTFYKIMDYFTSRSINFLQLKRGFVVKTEFLKNSPDFIQSAVGANEIAPMLVCDSSENLAKAYDLLCERIRNYHVANGVTIFGINSVFIDADAEIASGVVIYPNNIIKNNSVISSGCVLESGNIIDNSIVLENVSLSASYLKDSKVTQNKTLENMRLMKEVY